MALFSIPLEIGTAFWRQRVTLDASDYLLDFAWSGRVGAWFVSVFTANEVPIAESLKLVSNRPLLRRFKYDANCPPGELIVYDPTGLIDAPNYEQLSDGTITFYYADEAQLAGTG